MRSIEMDVCLGKTYHPCTVYYFYNPGYSGDDECPSYRSSAEVAAVYCEDFDILEYLRDVETERIEDELMDYLEE